MEHIDNPMTMYFSGDECNPDSPWFVDIDGLPTDPPEWEIEDFDKEPRIFNVSAKLVNGMPRLGY